VAAKRTPHRRHYSGSVSYRPHSHSWSMTLPAVRRSCRIVEAATLDRGGGTSRWWHSASNAITRPKVFAPIFGLRAAPAH